MLMSVVRIEVSDIHLISQSWLIMRTLAYVSMFLSFLTIYSVQIIKFDVCSLCWGIGRLFDNRFHFYYVGLIGYGNCQMCMSVVRIEVSDIGLKVLKFWELLINFCYTILLIFESISTPYPPFKQHSLI